VTRTTATAGLVARRLWVHATTADTEPPQYAQRPAPADIPADKPVASSVSDWDGASALLLLNDLEVALSRWIGAEGYRALLLNAARLTLPAHPSLSAVLTVDGFRPATSRSGRPAPDALASGMVALLEVLMTLLGRIVGQEMAERLVDLTGAPTRSTVPHTPDAPRHPGRMR